MNIKSGASPPSSFEIEEASDVLLVLLYAPGETGQKGEPVLGTTRLQKLFFLLRQGLGPGKLAAEARDFEFAPYKMGPFSTDLREVVNELEAAGIIKTEKVDFLLLDDEDEVSNPEDEEGSSRGRRVNSVRYSLTKELGMRVGEGIWTGLPEDQKKGLHEFKKFFNRISLRQLLIFTYERFPEFTSRSTIREQLGLK